MQTTLVVRMRNLLCMARVLANNFTAGSSPQDFDLSRNKSLRSLEFPARSIDGSRRTTSFLKYILSTITPSTCLKITLFYGEYHFHGVKSWRSGRPQLSKNQRKWEASGHHRRFEILREVHKVRDFQLDLCATVWGCFGEEPVRMLEEAIAEEELKGGFAEFPCKPSVSYNPQQFHRRLNSSIPPF